jgi:predicted dehydrogenase
MAKNIPILVAGFGSIGYRHTKNLLALGYKNVSVVETNKLNASRAENEVGAKIYTDYKKAIRETRPKITFICTPTNIHISMAISAVKNNSHVFIEKPLSHSLRGINSLISLSRDMKKGVMVACNYRFNKGFVELAKIVHSGQYGNSLVARCALGYYLPSARKDTNYKKSYAAKNSGGGVMLDSGIHTIDYLNHLLGDVRKSLSLKGLTKSLGILSEETASIILEHSSGTISSVSLDYVSRKPVHILCIVTDKGSIVWNFRKDVVFFEDESTKKILYKGNRDINQMYVDEIKYFIANIEKDFTPEIGNLPDAKKALKVLLNR